MLGCLNGGGQVKIEDKSLKAQRALLETLDGLYHERQVCDMVGREISRTFAAQCVNVGWIIKRSAEHQCPSNDFYDSLHSSHNAKMCSIMRDECFLTMKLPTVSAPQSNPSPQRSNHWQKTTVYEFKTQPDCLFRAIKVSARDVSSRMSGICNGHCFRILMLAIFLEFK